MSKNQPGFRTNSLTLGACASTIMLAVGLSIAQPVPPPTPYPCVIDYGTSCIVCANCSLDQYGQPKCGGTILAAAYCSGEEDAVCVYGGPNNYSATCRSGS